MVSPEHGDRAGPVECHQNCPPEGGANPEGCDRPSGSSLLLHYGPIYGRKFGETVALCRPPGTTATMTNCWAAVTCSKCLDLRYRRTIL